MSLGLDTTALAHELSERWKKRTNRGDTNLKRMSEELVRGKGVMNPDTVKNRAAEIRRKMSSAGGKARANDHARQKAFQERRQRIGQ